MMAFVYLLISTAIGVVLCESDICSTRPYKVCRYYDLMPEDYPDTAEDVKESCNDLQELVECSLNYLETCEEDTLNTPEFQRLLHFIRENCQEDSHLFQVISRNLDCFTPTIRSLEEECAADFISQTEFDNRLVEAGILFEDYDSMKCLEAVWMITCKTHLMGKRCNQELGNALLNILQITDYKFLEFCTTEVLSNLSLLIQAIEMTVSEGKWLEELNNDEE